MYTVRPVHPLNNVNQSTTNTSVAESDLGRRPIEADAQVTVTGWFLADRTVTVGNIIGGVVVN